MANPLLWLGAIWVLTDRNRQETCSNQLFYNSKCLNCGKADAKGEHL